MEDRYWEFGRNCSNGKRNQGGGEEEGKGIEILKKRKQNSRNKVL